MLRIHYYKDRKIFDENCGPADIFNDDIQTAVSKYAAANIGREAKKGMKEKMYKKRRRRRKKKISKKYIKNK